jgi:hypothetical protein
MAANGDRKSIGSNFGCTLRCEFFPHSFSQSSSDGTAGVFRLVCQLIPGKGGVLNTARANWHGVADI